MTGVQTCALPICKDLGLLGKLGIDQEVRGKEIDALVQTRNGFVEPKSLKAAPKDINVILERHARNAGETNPLYQGTREAIEKDLQRIIPFDQFHEIQWKVMDAKDIQSLKTEIIHYLNLLPA